MHRLAISLGLALAVTPWLAGCGDDTTQLGPQRVELNEEQAAAIRSADQQVDQEEGGPQKVIRATRPVKTARRGG